MSECNSGSGAGGDCHDDCCGMLLTSLVMTIGSATEPCEYEGPITFISMPLELQQRLLTMPFVLQFGDGPQMPAVARRELDGSIRVEKLGAIE